MTKLIVGTIKKLSARLTKKTKIKLENRYELDYKYRHRRTAVPH